MIKQGGNILGASWRISLRSYRLIFCVLWLFIVVSSCGSSKIIREPIEPIDIPPFNITITLPTSAIIDASQVHAGRLSINDIFALIREGAFSSDFIPVLAFYVEPFGTVLDDPMKIRLGLEQDFPAGTRLFLFYISPSGIPTLIDESVVENDGSILFDSRLFGNYLIAENRLIARPFESVIALGFADRAEGQIPLAVNFRAVIFGGNPPYQISWDFGDGTVGEGESISHVYTTVGEFEVRLSAVDSVGMRSKGFSTIITALSEYAPLKSVKVSSVPAGADPLAVQFFSTVNGGVPFGAGDTEESSAPFIYRWFFGDGSGSSEQNPVHRFPLFGLYRGQLEVEDAVGDITQTAFTTDLRRALLTAEPASGHVPLNVTFTVQLDGISPATSVTLYFGDGFATSLGSSAVSTVSHTYVSQGTYQAYVEMSEVFEGQIVSKTSNEVVVVVLPPPNPTIDFIYPAEGRVGDVVSVFGMDFGNERGSGDKVIFSPGVEAEVLEWRDMRIRVYVPVDAESGEVYVVRSGIESNKKFFSLLGEAPPPPVISFIVPDRGPPGTEVRIVGSSFGDVRLPTDEVLLGTWFLEVRSWSNTEIVVVIPQFASDGYIRVYHAGQYSNGVFFDVGVVPGEPVPVIDSIEPTEGERGSVVILNGSNFGEKAVGDSVFLNYVPMVILAWTDTKITVTVPDDSSNGLIQVYKSGRLSNGIFFRVLPGSPQIIGVEQR